jgi:hypothetical protein
MVDKTDKLDKIENSILHNTVEFNMARQIEYNNFSEGNYTNTYFNNPNTNNEKFFERDIIYVKNENKQLKETNAKLADKLRDLERKIKIANMQLEEVVKKKNLFLKIYYL